MALSNVLKVDFSFKKLKGREETTLDKQWYEEFAGRLLYPHARDIWVDDIPIPAPANSTPSVKVFNDLILTRDITVNYNRAWLTCETPDDLNTRIKSFIPPRFDQSYTARIFEDNGSEIPTAHPSNWVFDYENGILFFEENPADFGIQLPIHIRIYQYVGRTLNDIAVSGGDNTKVVTDGIAGEDLEAFQVVYFKGDGKVYVADKTNYAILDSIVGIVDNTYSYNSISTIVLNGTIINSEWNLITNKSYFLGFSGQVTDEIPNGGEVFLKIGTARDNNTLIFEPKMAIRR